MAGYNRLQVEACQRGREDQSITLIQLQRNVKLKRQQMPYLIGRWKLEKQ
jgi:hypothetical protein